MKRQLKFILNADLLGTLIAATLVVLFISFTLPSAEAASGITYQGRIFKPDGTPLLANNVQFRLQIRTPGAEDCLLYEETQSHDLSATNGTFAISLNDGSGVRQDTHHTWNLFDALSNRKPFTFVGADCTGPASYNPSATDNRKFRVYFDDGATGGWEALPIQTLNFIPMAIESYAVGGFPASSLLRVENSGTLGSAAPITSTQLTELLALIGGTTTQYSRPNQLNGSTLPTFTSGQSVRWTGSAWEAYTPAANASLPTCTAGQVLTSNGSSLSCVTDNAGTAFGPNDNITTTGSITGGSLSGSTVSSRDFRVYESTNTNYVSIRAPAGLTPNYTLTLPSDDGGSGQVLSTDGSGVLSWITPATGNVNLSNIRSTVNSMNPVFPSVACTTAETLRYDSLTDTYQCSAVTVGAASGAVLNGGNTGAVTVGTNDSTNLTFETNNSARMVINTSGNLGLGTVTPNARLDVFSTSAPSIRITNSDSTAKANFSATTYGGGVAGNSADLNLTRWRGTLGAPATPVQYDTLGSITAYGGSDPGSYTPAISAKIQFNADESFSSTASGGSISFYTQPVGSTGGLLERLRISASGNLGIGTDTPARKLHVNGNMRLGATALPGTPGLGDIVIDSGDANKLKWYDGSGWQSAGGTVGGTGDIMNGGNTGAVTVGTNNATSLTLETNNSPRVTVLSGGNVGIGVTNPTSPLHVATEIRVPRILLGASHIQEDGSGDIEIAAGNGSTYLGWGHNFIIRDTSGNDGVWITGSGNPSYLDGGGNFGIGTKTPERLLHVDGPMRMTASALPVTPGLGDIVIDSADGNKLKWHNGLTWQTASTSTATGDIMNGGNTGAVTVGTNDSTVLTLETNNTPRMSILANGNVGIGSSAPAYPLDVSKSASGAIITGRFTANPGAAGAANFNSLVLENSYGAGNLKNELKFRGNGADRWSIGNDPAGTGEQAFYIWDAVANQRRISINSSGNVGIGTNDSAEKLAVYDGRFASFANDWNDMYNAVASDGYAYANIYTVRSRGTYSAPTYPQSGDVLGSFQMRNYTADAGAGMYSTATQNHSGGVAGASLSLAVVPNGTAGLVEAMTILPDGNVGIGNNNPTTKLEVLYNGANGVATRGTSTNSIGYVLENWDTGGRSWTVASSGSAGPAQAGSFVAYDNAAASARLVINASGNVGIGTTIASQKLHVVGNIFVDSTYDCTMGNASGSVSCSSDASLKENVQDIPQALRKVLDLRGVEFDWNEKSNAFGRHDIGVIAQEVERVFPSVVHESKETGRKMVDYGSLVAPVIQAIKEFYNEWLTDKAAQDRKIASLEKQNALLLKQVEQLKERMDRVERSVRK